MKVHEERVDFEKRPVVTEEVAVHKRQVQDTERHTATVNREEAVIDRGAIRRLVWDELGSDAVDHAVIDEVAEQLRRPVS